MTKDIKFDLERSLKESPPKYRKGVRFVKRIVTKRSNIDWSVKYQPKVGIYDTKNVAKLRISYDEFGLLYGEPVQIVTPSTTPLGVITNTKLLTAQHSNKIIDASGNCVITPMNGCAPTRLSPF